MIPAVPPSSDRQRRLAVGEIQGSMTDSPTLPTRDELLNPLLEALKSLGGSASIAELNDKVAEVAGLTEEQLAVPHGDNRGSQVAYRLAWTRSSLKQYRLLENSSRGVWALTAAGKNVNSVDPKQVVLDRRAKRRQKTQGFCQNSGLSRHGGKLTQKLGPG